MTLLDVERLELVIGNKLPGPYKDILLSYPDELTKSINGDEPINSVLLPNSLERIIYLNKNFENFLKGSGKVVIGEDGCGNYFFMDAIDNKIYGLDHEEPKYFDEEQTKFDLLGSLQPVTESLHDYIEMWKEFKIQN